MGSNNNKKKTQEEERIEPEEMKTGFVKLDCIQIPVPLFHFLGEFD